MTYTVQCHTKECKAKRTYEGQTLGDCMKQWKKDGWAHNGKFLMCCPSHKEKDATLRP